MKKHSQSSLAFLRAQEIIPGGVNSPARAFKAVGGTPPFIKKAKGAHLWDIDGNEYIDLLGAWGPMILGHAFPPVVEAVKKQVELGTCYGTPTEIEVQLAELVVSMVPGIELVRMVNSGTEAVMSAIRLARGFTGRDKIIKFQGCYHGHSDLLLAEAGSGVATLGIPGSAGVPADAVAHTLTLPYNDLAGVETAFARFPTEIAVVVVEPVVGNMGVVLPNHSFLSGLRELTARNKALLLFDEVITGFRLHPGGAQALFGIQPDLTTLGKILGGGFPVGAYGGRKDIMQYIAPLGPVYQAGTLSGNPVAMQAGFQVLSALKEHPEYYEQLAHKGRMLARGLDKAADAQGVDVTINSIGSMFSVYFTSQEVFDYQSACAADTKAFKLFFHAMLTGGIYLPPSQFEAAFISLAHSEADLEKVIRVAGDAFAKVKKERSL